MPRLPVQGTKSEGRLHADHAAARCRHANRAALIGADRHVDHAAADQRADPEEEPPAVKPDDAGYRPGHARWCGCRPR